MGNAQCSDDCGNPVHAQRFFMTVSTHSVATVTSGLESDGTLLMNYGKFNTYRDGQQRVNATGSLSIPPNHSQGVSVKGLWSLV